MTSEHWRFNDVSWYSVCSFLQPDEQDAPFIRDYLERHLQMARNSDLAFRSENMKETAARTDEALRSIERLTFDIFGTKDPRKAGDVRAPLYEAIEGYRDLPHEDYQPFGVSLLDGLRAAHKAVLEAKENIMCLPRIAGREYCATARDQVICAGLQVYRRVHDRLPHAQNLDEKVSKFDWFIRGLTDSFTASIGSNPYPWATVKGRVNILRKEILPQTSKNLLHL